MIRVFRRTLFVPIYSSANIGQPGPDGHAINFMRTSDCGIEYVPDPVSLKLLRQFPAADTPDGIFILAGSLTHPAASIR